jgi:hypothetical protein
LKDERLWQLATLGTCLVYFWFQVTTSSTTFLVFNSHTNFSQASNGFNHKGNKKYHCIASSIKKLENIIQRKEREKQKK